MGAFDPCVRARTRFRVAATEPTSVALWSPSRADVHRRRARPVSSLGIASPFPGGVPVGTRATIVFSAHAIGAGRHVTDVHGGRRHTTRPPPLPPGGHHVRGRVAVAGHGGRRGGQRVPGTRVLRPGRLAGVRVGDAGLRGRRGRGRSRWTRDDGRSDVFRDRRRTPPR